MMRKSIRIYLFGWLLTLLFIGIDYAFQICYAMQRNEINQIACNSKYSLFLILVRLRESVYRKGPKQAEYFI